MMEQFGLWNLLKTMLSTTQTAPPNGESSSQATPQTAADPPPSSDPSQQSVSQGENACEQYLLRHETLRQKRK